MRGSACTTSSRVSTARVLVGRLLVLGAFFFVLGCRAAPEEQRYYDDDIPALSSEAVFAPSSGSGTLTIHRLRRVLAARSELDTERWAAGMLRIASLELALDEPAAARSVASEVVTSKRGPSARARAIGGLIVGRSLVAERRQAEAREVFDEARRIAVDAPLIAMLDGELATLRNFDAPRARDLAIVARSTWGAAPARDDRMTPMGKPTRITIHHSAVFCSDTARRGFEVTRIFQRTHVEDRGWGDIGYHWLIDRKGRILEGRDMRYQGAHAGDNAANRQNIGICLLGNFQPGTSERAQRPSREQLAGLEQLVRSLALAWDIPAQQVVTHREIHPKGVGATACPGTWLTPFVEDLRVRMNDALATAPR